MNEINKKKFIEDYNSGKPLIIQKELIADFETPISSLIKISKNEKYSFLLESVEGGDQRGRFSLLGCDPDIIWEIKKDKVNLQCFDDSIDLSFLSKDPIKSLKQLVSFSKISRSPEETPFPILVGYLGYSMIKFMENVELKNPDEIKIPDSVMIRPKLVAVFDNIRNTINIMTCVYPNEKICGDLAYDNAIHYLDQTIQKLNQDISKDSENSKTINEKIV